MADNSGGIGIIGVIIGALIVVGVGVAILGFGGFSGGGGKSATVNINPPAVTGSK